MIPSTPLDLPRVSGWRRQISTDGRHHAVESPDTNPTKNLRQQFKEFRDQAQEKIGTAGWNGEVLEHCWPRELCLVTSTTYVKLYPRFLMLQKGGGASTVLYGISDYDTLVCGSKQPWWQSALNHISPIPELALSPGPSNGCRCVRPWRSGLRTSLSQSPTVTL